MTKKKILPIAAMATVLAVGSATATVRRPHMIPYRDVVRSVASMVYNSSARRLASRHGLRVLNVMWEDTGRWQGSSVGPNISDVTIEVGDTRGRRTLMPVIRFPNFRDKTADVKLDRFFIRVGNEKKGGETRVISLRELLKHPTRYLSNPDNGRIKGNSLLAPRDTHALVSAQAAFLPVPHGRKAKFHPVIFNYQSSRRNPAVLTIVVTRQGTSMTIIDNNRHRVNGSWGQRLFFNKGGQRAPLTAERLSDVQERGTTSNGESASSLGRDANLLMIIQVPLKYRPRRRRMFAYAAKSASAAPTAQYRRRGNPSIETAVLGHGQAEGPYTELDGLTIERDPRFPVRVTVQFYQATTSGRVDPATMRRLARQIGKVYEKGDYVGSLVVPSPSDRRRPTNWDGVSPQPPFVSWKDFPGLWEQSKLPAFIGIW